MSLPPTTPTRLAINFRLSLSRASRGFVRNTQETRHQSLLQCIEQALDNAHVSRSHEPKHGIRSMEHLVQEATYKVRRHLSTPIDRNINDQCNRRDYILRYAAFTADSSSAGYPALLACLHRLTKLRRICTSCLSLTPPFPMALVLKVQVSFTRRPETNLAGRGMLQLSS